MSGADGTEAFGINDAGQIVGNYFDSSGTEHGFLYSGGTYTTLNDPLGDRLAPSRRASMTWARSSGTYVDSSGTQHGFLYSGGTYTTIDDALGSSTTSTGINNAGQIVGYYTDSSGTLHGFLATPPATTTYTFTYP